MELQTAFYIIGIITMTLYALLLLAIVLILIVIKRKITRVTQDLERRVNEVKDIADLGTAVADSALNKAASFFGARKKKS